MADTVIQLPPYPLPAKPAYGQKCNGCGFCCHMEICNIGKSLFPDAVAPCPAIFYEDNVVRCGVVLAEQMMKDKGEIEVLRVRDALGIDTFCDTYVLEKDYEK